MHARHNAPASDGELLPKFSGQMAFPWLTASLAGAAADLRAWRGRTCPGRSCPSLARDAAGSGCIPQEGDASSRCSSPQAHVPSCSAPATLLQSDAGKSCLFFFNAISLYCMVRAPELLPCILSPCFAPLLPRPRAHEVCCRILWRSRAPGPISSPSTPAQHLRGGSLWGFSIHCLFIKKKPFCLPKRSCLLA